MPVVAEIVLEKLRRLARLGCQPFVAGGQGSGIGVKVGLLLAFGEPGQVRRSRRSFRCRRA